MGVEHVAGVALLDLVKQRIAIHRIAALFQLAGPTFHARLAVGLNEQFHIRIGTDLGADIAPIQNRAAGLKREIALKIEQGGAHFGDHRHFRGKHPGLCAGEGLEIGQLGCVEPPSRRDCRRLHIRTVYFTGNSQPNRPVKQTGIEMGQAIMAGEPSGQSAFARRGWSIDGDDHEGPFGDVMLPQGDKASGPSEQGPAFCV